MSFTTAYYDLLSDVSKDPDYVSRPRGLEVKEKLCYKFKVNDPLDRLPYLRGRNYSLSYFVAESLWYLAGMNETDWISRYSAFWKKISDDGKTANSAYGTRIFRGLPQVVGVDAPEGWNQWNYVLDELQKDPDSRRAVIHIRVPNDSYAAVLDVPCTLALQFFLRDSRLHLCVSMRSSDALLGIGNDVPAFTLLQELMARQLSTRLGMQVGLGKYVHVSNSLHIYERDYGVVSKILSDPRPMGSIPMPPMPTDPPIFQLLEFEREVREANDIVKVVDSYSKGLNEYWRDWMQILASHWAARRGDENLRQSLITSTSFVGYHYFTR